LANDPRRSAARERYCVEFGEWLTLAVPLRTRIEARVLLANILRDTRTGKTIDQQQPGLTPSIRSVLCISRAQILQVYQ
jgi:hypothetical protein